MFDRYNSKIQLNQYLNGIFGKYDFILSSYSDNINPKTHNLIIFDKKVKSIQQKLDYSFVTDN